jgi:holo-[acyl-carrier protein] synthase
MNNSSILGIGNDIIEIERIREGLDAHGERFLERILTEKERKYCLSHQDPTPHLAARFSAKEAIVKAFGVGIGEQIAWKDLEIFNDEKGKPYVAFSSSVNEQFDHPKVLISISHCKLYVATVAVWVQS